MDNFRIVTAASAAVRVSLLVTPPAEGTHDVNWAVTDSGLPPADAGVALPESLCGNPALWWPIFASTCAPANATPELLGIDDAGGALTGQSATATAISAGKRVPLTLTLAVRDHDLNCLTWTVNGQPAGMTLTPVLGTEGNASLQLNWLPGNFATPAITWRGALDGARADSAPGSLAQPAALMVDLIKGQLVTGQIKHENALKEFLKKLSDGNATKRSYEPGCFAAGTLVHTKEGLRPIETVKVGDWVLSKHESGEGEREYKQVTQTFVHEDRLVSIALIRKGADGYEQLAVTPEHPFWVQGKGWKEVGKLKTSWPKPTCVETLSGGIPETPFNFPVLPEFLGNFPLFVTNDPEVAWVSYNARSVRFNYTGCELRVATMEVVRNGPIGIESLPRNRRIKPEHLFRSTVYNFEVEDFHTYYVGEVGVWVHNKGITKLPRRLKALSCAR
jgi:hypothetical protein